MPKPRTQMTTEAATKAANRERVAPVTGPASGIGLAITRRLLEAGMTVTALDANAAVHEILADQPALLPQLTTRQVDLRSDEAIQAMVEEALKAHGKIDILVNIAGIHPKKNGKKYLIEEITRTGWLECHRL